MSNTSLDSLDSLATFGELLRHLRRRARLTQRELGIAVGYSEAHIGRLESNERRPEIATVSTRFMEVFRLERESHLAARFIELARAAHKAAQGEPDERSHLTLSNLPAPLTRFVGRAREMAEVTQLLTDHRLVTLTGAGGVGKTQLALQIGGTLREPFADGVWLVELAAVSDPTLVPVTINTALKLAERADRSHLDVLAGHLETRQTLLVLDNCEHLIEACAELIESLLRRCPKLHVLATSRETLRVRGEVAYLVPSLRTPDQDYLRLTPQRALDYAAVQLLVERMQAADHNFEFTNSTVGAVARVCRQLDGIPLALELAAGLARSMTVSEIATRLSSYRALPAADQRTVDPRHQTMRRALDWSYDLLTPLEQRLLARLTVFMGDWTAEAAEAVCEREGQEGLEVVEILNQLVHKSLVGTHRHDTVTRYRLLEPIRQYADEKLREMEDWDLVRDRHTAYFTVFAERAEIGLMGNEHGAWLKQLDHDNDNLLAALMWSRDHEQAGAWYVRLCVSLWRYWAHHREYREGVVWMKGALARISSTAIGQRIKALSGAAILMLSADDLGMAVGLAEENLKLSREIGDSLGVGCALMASAFWARVHAPAREVQLHEESLSALQQTSDLWLTANETRFLGVALMDRDLDRAETLIQESFDMWQKMGSAHGMSIALLNLGEVALQRGEHEQAYALFEQSLPLALETGFLEVIALSWDGLGRTDRQQTITLCEQRLETLHESGDTREIAVTLHMMGQMILDAGDYERAGPIFEECLSLWQPLGNPSSGWSGIAMALHDLGHVARYQGELPLSISRYMGSLDPYQAAGNSFAVAWVHSCLGHVHLSLGKDSLAIEHFQTSLKIWQAQNDSVGMALLLSAMSDVAQTQGQTQRSAQLAGAAAIYLPDNVRARMRPIERLDYERIMIAARARLSSPDYATAWAEGAAMTLEQAVVYALSR